MEFTARTREEAARLIRATRPAWLRSEGLAGTDPAAQVPVEAILDTAAARAADRETGWAAGGTPGPPGRRRRWFRAVARPDGTWTIGVPSARAAYSADPEAFEAACAKFRGPLPPGDRPVPFRARAAALRPDSNWFAVQLAFTMPALADTPMQAAQTARFLHEAGITADPWPHVRMPGQPRLREGGPWEFIADRTALGGPEQVWTLTSPPLRDTPGTWQQLARACAVIRQYGGTADPRLGTGIEAAVPGFSDAAARRLEQTIDGYRDVLARLGMDPASRGYGCLLGRDEAPAGPGPQYAGNHLFTGSLDPAVIQAWTAITLALADTAARGGYQPPEPEPAGTHLAANPERRPLHGRDRDEETRSFRDLCDLLFGDDPDAAAQAAALFTATCWLPGSPPHGLRRTRLLPAPDPAGTRGHPEDLFFYHFAQESLWEGEKARLADAGDVPGFRRAAANAHGHALHRFYFWGKLPASRQQEHSRLVRVHGQGPGIDRGWIPARWQEPRPPGPAPVPGAAGESAADTWYPPGHPDRPPGYSGVAPGPPPGHGTRQPPRDQSAGLAPEPPPPAGPEPGP